MSDVENNQSIASVRIARLEAALAQSLQRLNETQHLARLGSWEWDLRTDQTQWSDELYRLYGLVPGELPPDSVSIFSGVHPEDIARVNEALAQALDTRHDFVCEHRVLWPDGQLRHVQARGRLVFDERGSVERLVGTVQDITEAKRIAATLEAQNVELRELDNLKSSFVSAVSHELRTPLTSIKGFAEFLEDGVGGPLSPSQYDFLAQIQRATSRLEMLVDDLLDFSRMDAGTFKLRRQRLDLAPLLRDVVDGFVPQARSAALQLSVSLPESPLCAEVDPQRIGQVVSNLLSNALKFTPEGGRVEVAAWGENAQIVCEVRDTGVGIAESDQLQLFKRFFQVDQTNTRRTGGMGLGLPITKALVEAHGGSIGVRSAPGEGSVFYFILPEAT